ncbi:MAG: (d)CMP kinase [Nitrospinota bacterium]|nr:(d)CMP kinase [Nitrospinota bacterium]
MIIAIDGPAGSGKSTIAKTIAEKLAFRYINSGAMYRAVAWTAQNKEIDLNNEDEVARVAEKLEIEFVSNPQGQKVTVDGQDATQALKTESVGAGAAIVAGQPRIREIMTARQRQMGRKGKVVMEGRDIGTVVFPQADLKFYFDADPEERGKRRYLELKAKQRPVNLKNIVAQIKQRDYEDAHRKIAPLARADDAIYVDTTHLNIEAVVDRVVERIGPAANV